MRLCVRYLFNSGLLLHGGGESRHDILVKFRRSVEVINSVLLLLYIVKLCIADAADAGIAHQNFYHRNIATHKIFYRFRRIAVSPACLVIRPPNAAVFADHVRLPVVGLPAGPVFEDLPILESVISPVVSVDVLTIVVNVIDIRYDMIIPARIDNGAHRIQPFGFPVNLSQKRVVLLPAIPVPCFIEGAPTDERGVIVVA